MSHSIVDVWEGLWLLCPFFPSFFVKFPLGAIVIVFFFLDINCRHCGSHHSQTWLSIKSIRKFVKRCFLFNFYYATHTHTGFLFIYIYIYTYYQEMLKSDNPPSERQYSRLWNVFSTSKPAIMTQSAQTTISPNRHKAPEFSLSKIKWWAMETQKP